MAKTFDIEDLPFEITETDRQNLIQGDEKFQPLTWEDLRDIIGTKGQDSASVRLLRL